jgi:hypothetical protein
MPHIEPWNEKGKSSPPRCEERSAGFARATQKQFNHKGEPTDGSADPRMLKGSTTYLPSSVGLPCHPWAIPSTLVMEIFAPHKEIQRLQYRERRE